MCGICGFISDGSPDGPQARAWLEDMNACLRHRGPDDAGAYLDPWAALAMRRLSIIDLFTGHQPVSNEDRSLWLVFNGEIYNYRELRADLLRRGHQFRSRGDSEVIPHAYEEFGEACVERFNGMFAFAIWNAPERRLFLARDRLGIKPLYYCPLREGIVFGSELKAVIAHPKVPRRLHLPALDAFLTLEYVPGPETIFEGIYKLQPGHLLTYQDGNLQTRPYWDLETHPVPERREDCVHALAELLSDAVGLQMVSDVPVGAFLSGGIDSSAVVALMAGHAPSPIRTFSIGFGDRTYNELPYARQVARRFQTAHEEAFIDPDIVSLIERLVWHLDEPFGDTSMLPTFLVSRLASRSVKVVLSGDGGDEVFAGYDTYPAQKADGYYRWLPGVARRSLLPALLRAVPPQPAKKGLINKAKRFVEGAALPAELQHVRWMVYLSEVDRSRLFVPDVQVSLNGCSPLKRLLAHFGRVAHRDPLAQQQYVDIKTYLVDDILTKVDRMSMATSLEARVPLLDHRVVEFAWSLPPHLKVHRGRTKVILREAMKGVLPREVLAKPKEGFSSPVKHWLRGPLCPLMTDLLSPTRVRSRGYFDPDCVSRWVREHIEGRVNHSHRLWSLMMFELWMQQVMEAPRGVPLTEVLR